MLQGQSAALECQVADLKSRQKTVEKNRRALEVVADDDDTMLALALSLSMSLSMETAPPDDDTKLALALSLSMPTAPPDDKKKLAPLPVMPSVGGLLLEERKRVEEAATHGLFRGVGRGTMAAKVDSVALRIGTYSYTRQECGASHGGHSNLCGYLSFTGGDGAAAVLLKQKLAPMANSISHDLGRNVNFAGLATLMENEVIMAYVLQEKTPVCVYNSVAQTAVTYYTAECVHDMVFLHCDGGHFQRLVRV